MTKTRDCVSNRPSSRKKKKLKCVSCCCYCVRTEENLQELIILVCSLSIYVMDKFGIDINSVTPFVDANGSRKLSMCV